MRLILPFLVGLFVPAAHADIVWTGAVSNDVFDEANWDLSNSTVTVVDPNISVDDNVLIANTSQPAEIPDLGGQIRFQIGDGYILTLDNADLLALGNDGVGGAAGTTIGPMANVINGGQLGAFFITNRTALDIGVLSSATFGGGATPINGSTVNITAGATLAFTDETVADYIAEHLGKTTVDGLPAVVDGNLQVISDGATGCVVTAISQFAALCMGTTGACPCGNDNDGSNGDAGCRNSMGGGGAVLTGAGSNSLALGDMLLIASNLPPSRMGVFFQGNHALNGGNGLPFGDGLRCAGSAVMRIQTVMADANGDSATTINIATRGGATPGSTKRYQLWYGDAQPTPCGMGFNLSNALEVVWAP